MAKYTWKKFHKDLAVWTAVVIIAIALAASMRIFLLCSFKIPSDSMHLVIEGCASICFRKR